MGNNFFRFKQFTVSQGGAAMKVGVDSVLLGAWVDVDSATRILDTGSGTGLLALMMAQRYPDAVIDAVEIDEDAHQQAIENVTNSPWSNRIRLCCNDFFDFADNCPSRYDLIISNPPYFTASLKPSDIKRNIARHNDRLPIRRFVAEATKLLTPNGMMAVVLPPAEASELIDEAESCNLLVKRTLHVQTIPSKPVSRIHVELSKTPRGYLKSGHCGLDPQSHENITSEYQEIAGQARNDKMKKKAYETALSGEKLCIEKADRSDYTDEYKDLTKGFYLKF